MSAESERRRQPRIPVNLKARWDIICDDEMRRRIVLDADVLDLSEGGCMARVTLPGSVSHMLNRSRCCGYVEFTRQPKLPPRIFAKNVWLQADMAQGGVFRLGFSFDDCSEEDLDKIRMFLYECVTCHEMD